MPSDLFLKTMNRVHRTLLTLSRGRVGWRAMDMPVVELSTTGRKSGKRHTVMLTSPLQLDGRVVVVASRGGDDAPPAWLLNLQAEPRVQVALQAGAPRTMHARVATPEERALLWPRIAAAHTNYADYQKRTEREIALVLLEPASGSSRSSRTL